MSIRHSGGELFEQESLMWAEAKSGKSDIYKSLNTAHTTRQRIFFIGMGFRLGGRSPRSPCGWHRRPGWRCFYSRSFRGCWRGACRPYVFPDEQFVGDLPVRQAAAYGHQDFALAGRKLLVGGILARTHTSRERRQELRAEIGCPRPSPCRWPRPRRRCPSP